MYNYLVKPNGFLRNGKFNLNANKVNHLTACLLHALGLKNFDVSLSFVSTPTIRRLNRIYRHRDKSTDVLSFPVRSFIAKHLGDVVVCPETAHANAMAIGHSVDREVAFLITHGVLHLCGYDHHRKQDAAKMFAMQRQLMDQLDWQGCVSLKREYRFHA